MIVLNGYGTWARKDSSALLSVHGAFEARHSSVVGLVELGCEILTKSPILLLS